MPKINYSACNSVQHGVIFLTIVYLINVYIFAEMKTIGDRISIKKGDDKTTVVISPKISSFKESLLVAWWFCWVICMGVFAYELFQPHSDQEQIVLFVLVIFMIYYSIRIGRVLLFRRFGMEFVKVENDEVTYKRSLRKYGKAHRFFVDNISEISVITKEDGSIAKVLENSFWVMGGERIGFKHGDSKVRLGMQLSDQDAQKICTLAE